MVKYETMGLYKQALYNTVGNIVYLLSIWLLTVFTTQLLNYEAVGNLTLAMALGNVFFLVQTYGIRSFQSSDMLYEYSPGIYLQTRFFTSLLGLLLCIITCLTLGYSWQCSLSIIMYLLFKTSEAISDVFFGDDQRQGKLEYAGYSLCLRGILTAVLFFAGAFFFRDLIWALFIITIGGILITLLLDFPIYRNLVVNKMDVSNKEIVNLLRVCFPLLLTTLLPIVIIAYPRIVLEKYYGTELLGYYGNISSPSLLLTTIVPVMLVALYPKYGTMFNENNYLGIMKTWYRSLIGTIVLSVVCVLLIVGIGQPVLTFVYTEKILPYIHYLYFILFAMMLYAFTACNGTVLVVMRYTRALIVTVLIALVMCVTTSSLLICTYGINGAIASLVVAYAVQCVLQMCYILYICRKHMKGNN